MTARGKPQMLDRGKIVARFLEACASGEKVSHRVSLRALAVVMRSHDALREVVKLAQLHPAAQSKFLEQWVKVAAWQGIRDGVADDDLWFASLRKLLPTYDGPAMQLYRGQRINEASGMSWTRSLYIAEMFAMYGTAVPREIKYAKPRDGQVVSATLREEIICAPCLLPVCPDKLTLGFHKEGEYIVDPRNVKAINLKEAA
ncbi:MAG TPA: hypothetical protein VHQ48_07090 [Bradyrhizobium sp.]|jgi:hypothetical protein|nr:hypothetical protein [Bradyrhizobium sp.]